MKVELVNNTQKKISEESFCALMECAEKVLRLPKKASVNIFFVDESEIKKLNSETRKINKVTDVLSFPIQDHKTFNKDVEGVVCLGDIIICPSYALKNAEKEGRDVETELQFLATHGVLHLCGYDHRTDKEQSSMDRIGNKILNRYKKL